MVRITNWMDKEFNVFIDTGEPSKYIELLLTDLNYRRKWINKENEWLVLDKLPMDKEKYNLVYTVKKKDNEDVEEFKFIIFLVRQAVDYINNLELIYNNSKED